MTEQTTEEMMMTRNDVIKLCGDPISEKRDGERFEPISLDENYFLFAGGKFGRGIFDKRLEFPEGKLCKVVYLDSDDNVIRIF